MIKIYRFTTEHTHTSLQKENPLKTHKFIMLLKNYNLFNSYQHVFLSNKGRYVFQELPSGVVVGAK